MPTLYSLPHSPYSARCRLAIYHKDIDIDIVPPIGGIKSSDYRLVAPTGKVPALVVNDHTLMESSAILEYLEDRFPSPKMRAETAEKRAVQRSLISFMDFSVAPQIFPLFKAILGGTRDNIDETIRTLSGHLLSIEKIFVAEKRGETNDLDMTDCGIIPSLFYAIWLTEKLGHPNLLQPTPTLEGWWKQRRELPAVKKGDR